MFLQSDKILILRKAKLQENYKSKLNHIQWSRVTLLGQVKIKLVLKLSRDALNHSGLVVDPYTEKCTIAMIYSFSGQFSRNRLKVISLN